MFFIPALDQCSFNTIIIHQKLNVHDSEPPVIMCSGGVFMLYIIKFIYGFLLPPGIYIILLFLLGCFMYKKNRVYARIVITLTILSYLFSAEITGELMIKSLEQRYQPPAHPYGDVIVMLGGGATTDTPDIDGPGQLSGSAANRLLTTVRIYKEVNAPIIVSGGNVYSDSGNEAQIAKRQLVSLGVPENKIIMETKSLNTTQNAEFTKRILDNDHFKNPILVTSAFHMARSVKNFTNVGVPVEPYPTDYRVNQKTQWYLNKLVPSDLSALRITLKEYLGLMAI
jgi:uncharacterized SAM-binding protein YcdF (DUF218 family)